MMRGLRKRSPGGFTLIELTLGMMAVGIIGSAVAAMVWASSHAYQERGDTFERVTDGRTIVTRIGAWVRQSKRIVSLNTTGNLTDILIWAEDDRFPGVVNLGELRLITYDSTAGTLSLYAPPMSSSELADALTNVPLDPLAVGSWKYPTVFRALPGVKKYLMADGVVSFSAALGPVGEGDVAYRLLEVRLRLGQGRETDPPLQFATAHVRAPDRTVMFQVGE